MTRSILTAGLLTLGTLACTSDEPGALPDTAGTPARVTVSAAAAAPALETYPATVVAAQEARVATRMSGRIREITVDVGSTVVADQVLVRLDDQDVAARMEGARAQAELAERSFRRVDNLAADGAASEQELDEARARVESARAQLEDARAQLAYVEVRAPFAGFVSSRAAEPGDLASPGQPLLTVVGQRDLEVVADLPSSRAGGVAVGARVGVQLPSEGRTATARIVRVVPALQAGSRRFRVEAVFDPALAPGSGVVPGSYARMEVPGAGAGGTRWIPADAVLRRGQLTGVFTVEASEAGRELRLRWLRLGRTRAGAVEVLAGPPGPLTVVRSPSATLHDGQPVAEATEEPWSVPGALLDTAGDDDALLATEDRS